MQIRNRAKRIPVISALGGCLLLCLIGHISYASPNDSTQTPIPTVKQKVLIINTKWDTNWDNLTICRRVNTNNGGGLNRTVYGCLGSGTCDQNNPAGGTILKPATVITTVTLSCPSDMVIVARKYDNISRQNIGVGLAYFDLKPSILCCPLNTYKLVDGDSLQKCDPPRITNDCIEP
jgi:hypothetical protein